ncbi:MAG: hypothetical protein ABEJ95_04980 [Candidatus Nanohalobium sp.]
MKFPELERLKEEKQRSYERFERHGDDFIDVMDDGVPEIDSKWASSDDIYEASDVKRKAFLEASGNRVFASIYNLLCEAEILDAFNNSPQYDINTNNYDTDTLIEAWEEVSGETYEEDDQEVDVLKTDNLYQALKED